MYPPGLAPAELSALLRLFKRRDRSNRLREPVEQHEEVTKFFPSEKKGNKSQNDSTSLMRSLMNSTSFNCVLLGGGV